MKVSVITPTLNREKFIEKTILSVLNQTYKNLEYIVVDGKSKDGTVAILEKYRNSGQLHYVSEPDNGMYDAINKGLRISTGDILAYLNADDFYFPWTVETAVKMLTEDSGCDIVYGDSVILDEEEKYYLFNFSLRYTSAWLRCGGNLPQPTVFFRRSVYERLGDFAEQVKYIADCEYWLRAIDAYFSFKKINEFLAVECNHEETLRNRFKSDIDREKRFLLKRYGCPFGVSSIVRTLYKRSNYVRKEFVTMRFIWKLLTRHNGALWEKFVSSHDVNCSILHYITNKIFRHKKPIWTVIEKQRSMSLPIQHE